MFVVLLQATIYSYTHTNPPYYKKNSIIHVVLTVHVPLCLSKTNNEVKNTKLGIHYAKMFLHLPLALVLSP